MFTTFKLPLLKSKTRTINESRNQNNDSDEDDDNSSLLCKPMKSSKTPTNSPKRPHKKRNSQLESCPNIASLRPGSVAYASEQLIPGDRIYSVNGIKTTKMHPEEVSTLLDNIDGNALLEIQYSLPKYASQNSLCVNTKITDITLERLDGSLGITLRGGVIPDHPHLSRPLIITQVRQNGPAFRSGLIRVGDRLLKVDNHPLSGKTLSEAQQLLKENPLNTNQMGITLTTVTIEYDVSLMELVKYANGPLLVEIERQAEEDFGLILTSCCDLRSDDILSVGYYIDHIIPASTADRCGALNIGDQILTINDLLLENWKGTLSDAEKLLRTATKLQILPYHLIQRVNSRNYCPLPSPSGFSSISFKRIGPHMNRFSTYHKSSSEPSDPYNYYGYPAINNMGVCHPETLSITLISERGPGYGLTVSVGEHSENKSADILISRITTESPAYRCGCLQVGDRIISINHQSNLTIQEITSILKLGCDSSNKIILEIEFDVADTIVPSSGIFTVKLAKRGPCLGITITSSKIYPDEPFIISDIRRGSIAHRTGTLHAGDRLLAIDNKLLNHLSLESAFEILQSSTNDIVTLKIEKIENDNNSSFLDNVVYTVELHRYGGPLGITISGSEDCSEPIILSRLTDGGLAEKTGALHVGDRILEINGENLEQRPLSDAIKLLQTSGDRVQMKISRHIQNTLGDGNLYNYPSPGLMSVDSAVHSWDSNTVDNNNITEMNKDEGESILSESVSYDDQDLMIKKKHDSQLQFYSDAEEIFCPSPLPLPHYNFSNNGGQQASNNLMTRLQGTYSNENILDNEIYRVTLYKDSIYDDYGFSVSDGLYEKGVYINRIRKGGPADIVGLLKPYDRIIQVNDTKTKDFDCCLTVPLIASAGDRIELIIARNPHIFFSEREIHDSISRKSLSNSQNTITKTL